MADTNQARREYDEYRRLDSEARALLDRAAAEQRDLTAEEDQQFDRLVEASKRHKDRSDQLVRMDSEARAAEDAIRAVVPAGAADRSGETAERAGITAFLAGEAMRQIALYNGGSKFGGETGIEAEARAIADFSDAASLYVDEFAQSVAVYQRTASPWLGLATVRTSTNGRPLVIPSITADPAAYTPGEGTAITEATPTFGTAAATLVSYKALAYVSMESDEDAMYDVMPYISRTQGRSLGLAFGSATTAAVLAAATNAGTATGLGGGGTATFIGLDDLLTLKYSLAAPYRSSGAWVMSNGMIQKARKYTDKNGQYLWGPSLVLGQPDTFDGRPVYEDPFLAAPGSATKSVVFGDASALMVKQVPLRFAVSTDYLFHLDQIALKAVYRAASALPDAKALAYMVSANV